MLLCVGAEGGGKTLLLRRLNNEHKSLLKGVTSTDTCTPLDQYTIPTTGVNITRLLKPPKEKNKPNQELSVRELGGGMSELWSSYYRGVRRLMYVVDAANWSQVASATLLLMPLLAHPHMQKAQTLAMLAGYLNSFPNKI